MYIETSPILWDKAIVMVNNNLDICLYEVYKYFTEDFECIFTEGVSFVIVSFTGFDIRDILAIGEVWKYYIYFSFLFLFLDWVEKHWLKFSFRSLIEFCCNPSGPEIFLGKSLFFLSSSQFPHLFLVFFKLLIDSYFNFCSLDEFWNYSISFLFFNLIEYRFLKYPS